MKIKSAFCAFAVFATFALATTVYASNEKIDLGTPIDLATGQEVTSYTVGQKIMVPVDVSNDELKAVAYSLDIKYNTEYLSGGIDGSTLTDAELEVLSGYLNADMTNIQLSEGSDTIYGQINRITKVVLGKTSFAGTPNNYITKALKDGGTALSMTWYDSAARTLNATEPEAYALFTVKKEVPYDSLNFELYSAVYDNTTMAGSDNVDTVTTNSADKANACLTAFKVSVDNDAIPAGTWIQKLYAKVGDTTQDLLICNNDGTSSIYEFPARVLTNSTGSDTLAIEIYAVTSSDEAGAESTGDVLIGTVNATADSTATDYSAGTFTANAGYAN